MPYFFDTYVIRYLSVGLAGQHLPPEHKARVVISALGLVTSSSVVAVGIADTPRPSTTEASFARPKSRILAWPRSVTKMFAGLMLRWTIPLACAASSASAISIPQSSTCSSGSGLLEIWCFNVPRLETP